MPYTEFCCRSGGSNLNAGTRLGDATEPGVAASLTYLSGSWVAATGVFTAVAANPLTDGVAVGDFASVYPDAATVTPFVGRVTARDATTITVSLTIKSGTAPVLGVTNTTLKIGGAWKGPNAAETFPFNFVAATMVNAAGSPPRVNLKNAAQYNVTASVLHTLAGPAAFYGYKTTYGDGINDPTAKCVFDGGVAGASYDLLSVTGTPAMLEFADIIVQNNGATGSASGIACTGFAARLIRCVAHDVRGVGITLQGSKSFFIECEAYLCNQSNTANLGGFNLGATGLVVVRCISHDNAGSNSSGFVFTIAGAFHFIDCIADSNGADGLRFSLAAANNSFLYLSGCDFYNNGSDAVDLQSTSSTISALFENCNFVKNAGWAVNAVAGSVNIGALFNCGFGSGSQVNTLGNMNAPLIDLFGAITYASGVTPWVAPATGDFRINLAASQGTGRGSFTQTQTGYTGLGAAKPDVGAAQHPTALSAGGGAGRSVMLSATLGVQ